MRTRKQLEDLESLTLEPYAAKCSSSQGRFYQEEEHTYRLSFQRDRDRIVHTGAFRRLEYKTQVFVNHEGDYYRTRLTHSLEVAQIGKTIARSLGVNENLTEAVCLAHDLGHTPFGHAGQDVMAELMQPHGGFEHNQQSFRIVTQLENPYPNFPGLNLTYEVLEGITKHSSDYDMPDGSLFKKSGFPSIEAQIGNLSDELAYNNHDLDDGIKSGLLTIEDLNNLDLWARHYKEIRNTYNQLTSKQLRRLMIRSIINHLASDVIENTSKKIQTLEIKDYDCIKTKGKGLVSYSEPVQKLNQELKKYLYEKLYRHEKVMKMAYHAKTVLADLFKLYTSDSNLIPNEFIQNYKSSEAKHRIICDYIAGMTDRFALDEHKKYIKS